MLNRKTKSPGVIQGFLCVAMGFERGSVERDDQLTKAIKEVKEQKKLIAAANENPDTNPDKQKKATQRATNILNHVLREATNRNPSKRTN
ncbi:hypothetical protein J2Y73_005453 [Peribacillus frigoritolerans]|uniref:DUF3967 domain-containing protein n=1 Tax=Peribacillus frigoritolerans TaxID=450367 RepID=UPI00209E701B|nr:DUF3967 domain-containing protein [Peribacillus frigoritolerans]MCP1495287.1 hypothetical protein [Peribacillus frigoritolerans]